MTVTTRRTSGFGVLEGGPYDPLPDIRDGLGARFFESMAKNGEKSHHIEATTGETETKASVRSKAIKLASLMKARGIKEGHIIVISSKPHLDQTVALLACWFAGATVAPLHAEYDYEDLKRSIKMLQPKCAFCGNRSSRLIHRIFIETNIRCPIVSFSDDSKQFAVFKKCYEGRADPTFKAVAITQPKKHAAVIIYTLGTEGIPKLVAVSHHSLFISCTMHILASCLCFDTSLRLVYAKYFTEKSLCKHLQDLKIEHMFIDGDLATRVARNTTTTYYDLRNLKTIYVAGMPLSTTNFARVCKAFNHVNVYTTYQTIETGMMTIVSQDVFTRNRQKVLSVGKLYPGINIRVVDLETKQILGADKQGEIQVRSAALMLGYYRNPELTSRSLVKGFYKTGDIGLYDSDGYIYIKGRISDHINRNGHLFASEDIEEVIRLNPAVSDVACIDYQDDIIACVIKKRGEDITANTLLEFVADVLPPHKLPTKVVFREFFPKTVLGVVKKHVFKENIAKILYDDSA